jgi:hypothetical protein
MHGEVIARAWFARAALIREKRRTSGAPFAFFRHDSVMAP